MYTGFSGDNFSEQEEFLWDIYYPFIITHFADILHLLFYKVSEKKFFFSSLEKYLGCYRINTLVFIEVSFPHSVELSHLPLMII